MGAPRAPPPPPQAWVNVHVYLSPSVSDQHKPLCYLHTATGTVIAQPACHRDCHSQPVTCCHNTAVTTRHPHRQLPPPPPTLPTQVTNTKPRTRGGLSAPPPPIHTPAVDFMHQGLHINYPCLIIRVL